MNLMQELKDLGFLYQCSDYAELFQALENGEITFYLGIDCTAESLHIGHLMSLMLIKKLQRYGNKPILLIGGGTTKIGDPTGKNLLRKELAQEQIDKNIIAIKKSLSKFLEIDNDKPNSALIVNNALWLDELQYIEFLRNFGRYFSVNKMLTMESVKTRLDQQSHFTFLEFNYMLLQAYDFYHLNKQFDCQLQIGGSDQWGNILFGVDLIKSVSQRKSYALTTPLMTNSDGKKMGKTTQGAIWINENLCSAYQYFQFWKNVNDNDVIKFAKIYCDFDANQLKDFISEFQKNILEAKNKFAYRITELCHGTKKAQEALVGSKKIFQEAGVSDLLPKILISKNNLLNKKIFIYSILNDLGFVKSKTKARKAILTGAVKIDDNVILEIDRTLSIQDFQTKNYVKLSYGKKMHALVQRDCSYNE